MRQLLEKANMHLRPYVPVLLLLTLAVSAFGAYGTTLVGRLAYLSEVGVGIVHGQIGQSTNTTQALIGSRFNFTATTQVQDAAAQDSWNIQFINGLNNIAQRQNLTLFTLAQIPRQQVNYTLLQGIEKNITALNSNMANTPTALYSAINAFQAIALANRSLNAKTVTIEQNSINTAAYYGVMLPQFRNRIRYSASQSVQLCILTNLNYAAMATNSAFSCAYTYLGSSQNILFNQSEGCPDYMYMITGSGTTFTLNLNTTAVYTPSNVLTGVC